MDSNANLLHMIPYQSDIEAAVVGTVIIGVGLWVTRWTTGRLLERGASPRSVRAARLTITLVSILVAAAAVFVLIGPIGVVSGLTFSAIIGLAATLALQTTLQNIIAGFILLQNRVLRLDDTITVSGVTGRVVQIGLVTVLLRMDDGNVATVSNASLLSGPMINRSARERLKGEF
jgi:small conductance mechanosensitive channel